MAPRPWKTRIAKNRPFVAICDTRHEAVYLAHELRRARLNMRGLSIVENAYPSREAAAKLEGWDVLRAAWVSLGCLNAIGADLDCLGIRKKDARRCAFALNANKILIVVHPGIRRTPSAKT